MTSAGLVTLFHLEEKYQPTVAYLSILETPQEMIITETLVTGYTKNRPKV